jgi:hypothetical protein
MRFSAFSSILQKLAFQRSKSQLKSLLFVSAFGFSAFRLKKPSEKQKQTRAKLRRKAERPRDLMSLAIRKKDNIVSAVR